MISIPDFDPAKYAGNLPSPCINVCKMHPQSGLCVGCWRSIDEIMQWSTATEQRKHAIWLEIKRRSVHMT